MSPRLELRERRELRHLALRFKMATLVVVSNRALKLKLAAYQRAGLRI